MGTEKSMLSCSSCEDKRFCDIFSLHWGKKKQHYSKKVFIPWSDTSWKQFSIWNSSWDQYVQDCVVLLYALCIMQKWQLFNNLCWNKFTAQLYFAVNEPLVSPQPSISEIVFQSIKSVTLSPFFLCFFFFIGLKKGNQNMRISEFSIGGLTHTFSKHRKLIETSLKPLLHWHLQQRFLCDTLLPRFQYDFSDLKKKDWYIDIKSDQV